MNRVLLRLVPIVALVAACGGERPAPEPPATETPAPVPAAAAPDSTPLLVIMQGLARDVGDVNAALWREDWTVVAGSARKVADHPGIPPGDLERIRGVLGAEMEGFAGFDGQVHDAALAMAERAGAADPDGFLAAYGRMQDGCVRCHAAYRERLRPALRGEPAS